MDNVPSSAILAIVAIVAACLLGAFIFTTVQSQKESGNQAIAKTEAMNTSLDESTFTQYDGATVTGSQVKAAIKLLKNEGVAVYVDNGKDVTKYLNNWRCFLQTVIRAELHELMLLCHFGKGVLFMPK